MTLQVIPMAEKHIAACAEIMANTPLWRDNYGVTYEKAVGIFEKGLADSLQTLCVSLLNENIVGFAYYGIRGALYHGTYLRLLAVHPNYRGKGIGEHLLTFVEQDVIDTTPHLFLVSAEKNTAAHRFYYRMGYQHIGTIPAYVVPDVNEWIFHKRLRETGGI